MFANLQRRKHCGGDDEKAVSLLLLDRLTDYLERLV